MATKNSIYIKFVVCINHIIFFLSLFGEIEAAELRLRRQNLEWNARNRTLSSSKKCTWMGAHGKPVKRGTRGNVGGKGPLGGRVGKGKAKAKRVGQGMTRGLEEHIRGRHDKACFPLPQVQGSGRGRGVTIGPSRTGGPSHTHPSEEYRNMSRGDLPKSNIFHVPRPDPREG